MVHQLNHRKATASGFSLIELLTVLAIMVVLLSATGLALAPFSRALDLSSSTQQIQGALDLARQKALSSNKYVQVRFYAKQSEPACYSAIGLFVSESPYYATSATSSPADFATWINQNHFSALAPIQYLSPSLDIPAAAGVSKLLADLTIDTDFQRNGTDTIRGVAYNWVAFYYLPNGSADFQTFSGTSYPPDNAFFSLVIRSDYAASNPALPKNYSQFFLPPSTGRPIVLRP